LIDWLTNLTKSFSSNKKKFLNIIKKANAKKKGIERINRFEINYGGKKGIRGASWQANEGKGFSLLIRRFLR
jgi:hypothetical protein